MEEEEKGKVRGGNIEGTGGGGGGDRKEKEEGEIRREKV